MGGRHRGGRGLGGVGGGAALAERFAVAASARVSSSDTVTDPSSAKVTLTLAERRPAVSANANGRVDY
ncbi:MAG: hypothetical protein M3211_00125 [Actinomycetota bacterium]|nr:hypothetical protein [Actinomycetota bacterium]